MKKTKPTIMILATGGTVASLTSACGSAHYSSAETSIETMVSKIPELNHIATIKTEQVAQINSENMTEEIWFTLARRIQHFLDSDDIDGIVVTHGTDTMEETAYFLNLVINTKKPLVLTGAMRPFNALSADGFRNLYQSVLLAASAEAHKKGVLVLLNDMIHSARDITKINSTFVNSFQSPNSGRIGHIHDAAVYFYRQPDEIHTWQSQFHIDQLTKLAKVAIIYGHVGIQRTLVDACVAQSFQGIVSAGLGMGYQPEEVHQALIEASQAGLIVVRCSRVQSGFVSAEEKIDQPHGFITSGSLNPQKSRILLALSLMQCSSVEEIQQIFNSY